MSKRLAGYDYSQPGFYFVTICTQEHRLVFGTIVDGQVNLRGPGQIAHVKLDEYVFMPNHMHAIVELIDIDPAQPAPEQPCGRLFVYLKQQPHTKFVVLKEIRGLHGKMTITIP